MTLTFTPQTGFECLRKLCFPAALEGHFNSYEVVEKKNKNNTTLKIKLGFAISPCHRCQFTMQSGGRTRKQI